MKRYMIGIAFANNPNDINNFRGLLRKSVKHASYNLMARYGIELTGPFSREKYPFPYVVLDAPDNVPIDISHIGGRLRGITLYMMEHGPNLDRYKKDGRTLRYFELPKELPSPVDSPEKHQYTVEELTDIWSEFEKEWHLMPCTHLCAEDVHKFLDFLKKKEEKDG